MASLRIFCMQFALAAALLAGMARAEDAPALQGVSAEEKARVQKLIDGAKAEGAFSYWDAVIQPQSNDALVAAFRAHYGLPASFKVNYTLSATGVLVTRIEQEISAKRITIDLAGIASPSWVFERVAAGDILEYDSPEYTNYGKVFEQDLGLKGYFAFNGGYIFVPMWNSETLPNFKGTSFKDVINAVPEGRLSIGDSGKSVTYIATHFGLLSVLGKDYFAAISKMKPPLVLRSESIAARLVSGEDLMAFTGMPTRAYQFNQKGAKLKFMMPEEGVVLMPQSMFILKGSPHPNAAKLWVDFMLSEKGQTILVKHEALISGRAGFKSPIPDYAPPIESLKIIRIDWKKTPSAELIKERIEWAKLFSP